MEQGVLTAAVRRLDPAVCERTVRGDAVAGLPGALTALLGGTRSPVIHAEGEERLVLVAGSYGAVACVHGTADGRVSVLCSVAPEAVRELAGRAEASLDGSLEPAPWLGASVGALLTGFDAVARAARQGVADGLHDGPVQELTAAQLLMESAVPPDGGPVDREFASRGIEALRGAIASCRDLMRDLSEDA